MGSGVGCKFSVCCPAPILNLVSTREQKPGVKAWLYLNLKHENETTN